MFYIDGNNPERETLEDGRIKEVIRYTDSGKVFCERFYNKNEELEGEAVFYHESGKKQAISHFKEGKLHGMRLEYDEEGNVTVKETYVMDEKVSK